MRSRTLITCVLAATGTIAAIAAVALIVDWLLPRTVVFVVPAGFRGAFVIIEDAAAPPAERHFLETTVAVPASGELRVRSAAFLGRPSAWSARYSDGIALLIPYERDQVAGQVSFWGGGYGSGSAHGPRYDFFVGTRAEFENFDFWAFKPGVP